MHHARGLRALALGGSILAGLAAPAFAQTAEEATVDTLVVTAERREEAINDVGMAIQAFRGEQLEQLHVTDVKDLSTIAPSFTVSRSYQGVPTYTLRGIGFNTINMSATSTVGTYVDEVAYAYPFMMTGPVFDLERVEVLKGPQGTLYGRNTTAGLINFVTNKPTQALEARLSGEVGNYDTLNFEGTVSGPLAEGLAARIAFRTEDSSEGWQKSRSRGERLGEVHRDGARLSVAADAGPLSMDFSYSWWRNQSDTLAAQGIGFTPATAASPFNAPGLVAYIAANRPTDATQADWASDAQRMQDIGSGLGIHKPLEEDSDFHGVKLRIGYEFSDTLRLVSLTSWNDLERKAVFDWSGAPYEVLIQDAFGTIESIAQEIRLEGEHERVDWLVGGYVARDDIVDSNRTMLGQNANVGLIRFLTASLLATPFNAGGYTPLQASQTFRTYSDRGDIETTTASLFANADWKLTEALSLTTGLRYTRDKQDYAGCSRDFNTNMLTNVNVANRFLFFPAHGLVDEIEEGDCVTFDPATHTFGIVTSELDENNLAWRVALDWKASEDVLVYGSISRGYKAGATPINAANISTQNAPATQEMLLAYEAGVKAGLFERRVQANASFFYYDYEDKQLSVYFADPIYTALARLANVPEARAYGIDADLTWRATNDLTLTTSATWLETEVIDYVGINAAGQPQNFDGAEFLYSPKWQASATAIYDRPLTDVLGLQAALNARYQSKSRADFGGDPNFVITDYTLVNGSVGIHTLDHRWELMAWGRNLTDEYYWSAVSSNANVVVRFPGQPRTFGLTLTYNY